MTSYRPGPASLAAALIVALIASAACTAGGGGQPGPTDAPLATPSPTTAIAPAGPTGYGRTEPPAGTTAPTSEPPASGSPPTDPPALPADPWRTAQLTDVRTGEVLVVNDLYGKLVVLEPMAIWCTTCRAQQNEAREALVRLASADIVYISLDVDPNESEADLASYADEREYPWHFVVAGRDVARSLAQSFGDQVLSPPSTPEIIVRPDGTAEVSYGLTDATELEARFAALLP